MRKLRILLCCCLMMMPILACADSTPLAGYRICIDPGHQARLDDRQEPIAPGSTKTKMRAAGCAVGVRTHVRESVRNLEIALKLRDALEQMGAEVLLTRDTEDVWVSNVQRAQMANQFRADVYLRLHCNAHGNPRKRGICIYAPRRSAECLLGIAPAQMLAWSEAMADTLQCATGAPSARATTTNAYSGSNWALMPTFLIEMGYFSNVEDDLLLASDSYQAGLIAGIASFLQTMPRDIYRDHPVLCAPIMENRRSTTEKMTVYATPDTSSAVLATIGRNYRVFALDNLGNGFTQVQTYQKGIVGYTDCQTLTPCR